MKEAEKDRENFYPSTFAFAKENGEQEQFRNSYRLDLKCGSAIDNAICDNFDGMFLNKNAVDSVLGKFCTDRISHVLADTVVYMMDDGRFSRNNKEWAMKINPEQKPNAYEDHIVILQSHPAVLNGFINTYRKKLEEA